jgi:hypothetical protein
MAGTALRFPAPCDEARALEHLKVLGDGLEGDGEGLGDLVDGGIAQGQPREYLAADRIGEGHERPVELVFRVQHRCSNRARHASPLVGRA